MSEPAKESKEGREGSKLGSPAGSGSGTPVRARTNRMLLETFYGSGSGGSSAPREDPNNIDGVNFDPEKYTARFLQQASLKQLLDHNQKLQEEIKEMDSDMKMLVYENYNKFISATDTIRNMKQNVGTIETEMEQLTHKMDNIMECADRINAALSGNRDRLERLTSAHRLLKRLQFVVALPARLRKCIEMGSYVEAVQYYSKTRALIQKNNHLPSFARIQTECSEIMGSLKDILYRRVRVEPPVPGREAAWAFPLREIEESAGLLLSLDEPADQIREKFCASHRIAFEQVIMRCTAATSSSTGVEEVARAIGPIFFVQLLRSFESYKTLFIGKDVVIDDELVIQGPAWEHLQKFLNDVVEHYLRFVQQRVAARNAEAARSTQAITVDQVQDILAALAMVHSEISQVGRQLPFLHLAERASELVGGILVNFVENVFTQLVADCKGKLETVQSHAEGKSNLSQKELEEYWGNVGESVAVDILTALDSTLEALKPITESEHKFIKAQLARVTPKIHIKTQQFLLSVEHNILKHIAGLDNPNSKTPMKINPTLILALCLVSRKLVSLFESAIEAVTKMYVTEVSIINVDDLRRRFVEMSSALMGVFISNESSTLAMYLSTYISLADWLSVTREPREVGVGVQSFVAHIKETDALVRVFFPDAQPQSSSASPALGRSRSSLYASQSHDRRFATAPAQLEMTRAGIISQIVRTGLKSMHELVRLCTFGLAGLHAMQLDKHYVYLSLWPLLSGTNTVREFEGMLENIETALEMRCIEDKDVAAMPVNVALRILQAQYPDLTPPPASPTF
eukprot:m51a1_g3840 hypothetical protein (802) ;mRNA; f:352165-355278